MDFTANGGTRTRTESDGKVRMPFGKHRGVPIDEVPNDYLLWTLAHIDFTNRPTLREAIRSRLGLADPRAVDLEAVIKAWYRRLALDFHPDRRGSHEAMVAINEAHARLLAALKLAGGPPR